jgi:hypothetical protein
LQLTAQERAKTKQWRNAMAFKHDILKLQTIATLNIIILQLPKSSILVKPDP